MEVTGTAETNSVTMILFDVSEYRGIDALFHFIKQLYELELQNCKYVYVVHTNMSFKNKKKIVEFISQLEKIVFCNKSTNVEECWEKI